MTYFPKAFGSSTLICDTSLVWIHVKDDFAIEAAAQHVATTLGLGLDDDTAAHEDEYHEALCSDGRGPDDRLP